MKFLVQQQPAEVYCGRSGFRPSPPTCLFIHGAANDHRVWRGLIDALDDTEVNLIAVDLPGHGATFAEAKNSIAGYADWVLNLMDNGAMARATLIGHSMGSLIALDCAKRHPSRLDKLVLIGTALPMPVAEKVLVSARDTPEAAYDMLVKASFYVQKNADGTWPPPTPAMKAYRAILADSRHGVLSNDMLACNQYAMSPSELNSIATPTLVLIGAEDRMTSPVAGSAVTAAMPNAEIATIHAAGHAMVQQQEALVATHLQQFIGKI
jgi:pimeloyl-ACP methyl ester carboxylesterase